MGEGIYICEHAEELGTLNPSPHHHTHTHTYKIIANKSLKGRLTFWKEALDPRPG